MKKSLFLLLLFYSFSLSSALASEEKPKTIYARGDNNELPAGYTHALFNGGGLGDFKVWVAENLQAPENLDNDISGRVIVSFVIDESGGITDMQVLATPHESLSGAVLSTMAASSGKWSPGTDPEGETVRIRYVVLAEFVAETPTFIVEDSMPEFQNGDLTDFRRWVMERVNYPRELKKARIKGNVVVTFVVERDGSVTNVQVITSLHPDLDKEAIRVIKESPKWKPGMQDGSPVKVRFNLPVTFGK